MGLTAHNSPQSRGFVPNAIKLRPSYVASTVNVESIYRREYCRRKFIAVSDFRIIVGVLSGEFRIAGVRDSVSSSQVVSLNPRGREDVGTWLG